MSRLIPIVKGEVFGFLRIIRQAPTINKKRYVVCKCIRNNCNRVVTVRFSHITLGATLSCGCYNKSLLLETNTKHGLSKLPIYSVWLNMIKRCTNKNHPQYKDYGGRGITVCKEWLIEKDYKGLKNFIAWNESLSENKQWAKGLEIDRINNDKGYKPGNCRWITCIKNINNRRCTIMVVYKRQNLSLSEAVEKYGVDGLNYKNAYYRYSQGWSIKDVLEIPIKSI